MKALTRFRFFLWYFSHYKVPMIGYVRPRLVELDAEKIVVKIPLHRRTRNHLHSMYFGALAVGADIAGGLHGFYHAEQEGVKISLAFKSFQAEFLQRPESDVYFICDKGKTVKNMIQQSRKNGLRLHEKLPVKAYVNYPASATEVASFILELSIKVVQVKKTVIDKPGIQF
ncbi:MULTISPECIES: DUF4442 domain-containing protein [Legionella]|uniref:DUF4442 domain-containing protein n=1 Tax=Legionella TaxID=445 RepID=UPI000F8C9869|nr:MULTISPECIES: DUF4442 domain-containing protein [Legionella]MCP0913863.1 DUF4442 domain-containing protein [Legionella sp. 27cVA30]RUR09921.1 DUF4442 domain-containing protein [Legionella septentrionalis]